MKSDDRMYSRTSRVWAVRKQDGWTVESWDSGVIHQGLSADSAKVKLDKLDPPKVR